MIKQLLVNAATLIASLFIIGQRFVDAPITHESPIRTRVFAGIICGIVGSILVNLGVNVTPTVVVDFRYIALIVSAMYGGPLTLVIGAAIIATFRFFYFGVSYASIVAAAFIVSATIGCGIISKLKISDNLKWLLMIIFCQINSIFALGFVIEDRSRLISVCITYCLLFSLISFLVYYYSNSISQSNTLVRKLKMESSKDFLTGINNVRSFDNLYNTAIQNAGENGEKLSIAVIDIDYFKRVNDKYGHPAGDAILKQLGQILQQSCRDLDIVSRNGGEEFSILLKNCSNELAYEIAERIRKKVETYKFTLPDKKQINITISIGIATFPGTAEDHESLYKNADKALYKAKSSGRNKVCTYTD